MEEKSNGELAFLDKESVARKVFFSPCLIKHIFIITNKDDLYEENVRINQVLKESGYHESIISKIFKRFT